MTDKPVPVDAEHLAAILIKRHEGYRQFPYHCTVDKLTIAYGRNIEEVGLSKDEAIYLLNNDIKNRVAFLSRFSFYPHLSHNRQAALIDMTYQLGATSFRKFKKTIKALNAADYNTAANEMLDSKWATETPERAKHIANLIRKG